jgi:hypothetical protein
MTAESTSTTRFPFGYAIATLLPIAFLAGMYGMTATLDAQQSMGPAMLCSLLIGPSGAIVAGWGALRLGRGDGQQYPALRWLVAMPLLSCVAGFFLA